MEGGIPKGTQVGSYVIDSHLGRGGMGIVYRAYHPRLQRWAAIKVLPPFTENGDARDRFEREARAIARLRHRHILTVFDFGEFAGQPFMAVEFMPNGSLQERMPSGPISIAQALTLLRPLAEALDYAHAQGVLHRDVKPANVFLDSDMQPVLADFGLAKLYQEESMTATGLVSGTPTHMSPEQANGRPLSGATDQYALGIMAYQLIAGRLPFQGQLMELLYAHVNTAPPQASTLNGELTPLIDAVLERAIAKDPAQRYPSCMGLVSALEAAAAGRADERAIARPGADAAATVVAAMPAAAPLEAPSAAPPRGRGGIFAAAAAVIVMLAIGGTALATGLVKLPSGIGSPPVAGTPTPESGSTATPIPTVQRDVSIDLGTTLTRGSNIRVSGHGLADGAHPSAGFRQGNTVYPISGTDLNLRPDGSFLGDGVVPTDLRAGNATLIACPNQGNATGCIALPVTIR
jgi:eukaryotic-like serine/threonine-protein kinase